MKSNFSITDTIAGIANPAGGAISIIRISGDNAAQILSRIFTRDHFESHRIYHGWIHANGVRIDEVLAVVMRAPRSFTTQDVVEIHCHGSAIAVRQILAFAAEQTYPWESRLFQRTRMGLAV